MSTRIYLVKHKPTSTSRLVRAINQSAAVRHVVRDEFTTTVAKQDDLVTLLPLGMVIETAGVEPVEEQPEAYFFDTPI